MMEERRQGPAWAPFLSPAILMLAGAVWIWFYLSRDPLDESRNLSLVMAIICGAGAIFRLLRAMRRGGASGS
jgi:hypothetical protein